MRPARKGPPPKVIVYSGFRTHAAVIDLALTSAGVNFENIARMGMTRAGKDAALASFRGDPQTAVCSWIARRRRVWTSPSCRACS